MNISKTLEVQEPRQMSRVKRLRQKTHDAHEQLENRILDAGPFASRDRYGRFLHVQHQFHRDIDMLYDNPELKILLPDLDARRRLDLVKADLTDIGLSIPVANQQPTFSADVDVATALGWLYVAEGSNLGAAILLKRVAVLDLDENFGARHLAGKPQGRALNWRTFTSAFDAVQLSDEEENRVISGGVVAFDRVRALVEEVY